MKIKQNDLYTNLFIICVMFYYALRRSVIYMENFKIILLAGIVIGCYKVLISMKFSLDQFIKIGLFSLIIILLYFILGNISLLIILAGIVVCSDADIYHIMKISLIYKFIFLFLFWILGLYNRGNVMGIEIGVIILLFIAIKNGKLKIYEFFWIFILVAIGVYMSMGSGSFIIIMILTMFILAFLKRKYMQKILKSKLVCYVFPMCFFLNVFFALCVNENSIPWIGEYCPSLINRFLVKLAGVLDEAMSYRLSLSKVSLEQFGVNLVNKTLDMESFYIDENSYFYLDSGYLNIVQGCGIIFTVVIMILFVLIMTYLVKYRLYGLIIVGICLAFWGINEPVLTYIDWNFILLVGGKVFMDKKFNLRKKLEKERKVSYEYT